MSYDVLVVGAGLAGCTCAERFAAAGKRVLVVDRRDHVAGMAYDYYDEHGILVHKYGAHVFHTHSREVYDYLGQFTGWRPYEHRVLSSVNGQLLPVPINQTTLDAFGGDAVAARMAMIEPYTQKQWGPYASELLPSVFRRVQLRESRDDRYFTDPYQAMPVDGYTAMCARMLARDNITVQLGTPWRTGSMLPQSPRDVICTGSIDEFFDCRFGELPYRSAFFGCASFDREWYQPVGVVNHPAPDKPYTRVIEFKHMTGQAHAKTSIAVEYPSADGEPLWPVPTEASMALYRRYADLAEQIPDVHFIGRLGRFQYLDMDAVVAQALKLSAQVLGGESSRSDQMRPTPGTDGMAPRPYSRPSEDCRRRLFPGRW